jgi:hypothetical protein
MRLARRTPYSPLAQDLSLQVKLGALPALAMGAVALEHPMLYHFHWLGLRQLDNLSRVVEALAMQATVTLRTAFQSVLHRSRGRFPLPSVVVLWITLAPWLLGLFGLGVTGFDERGRAAGALFQFGDALSCRHQRL